MVGSIDPRCETIRGTHWPKPGRVVVGNSRRGSHLGQRLKPTAPTGRTYGCKRSGHTAKPLVPRGPSTYGSRRSPGRRIGCCVFAHSEWVRIRFSNSPCLQIRLRDLAAQFARVLARPFRPPSRGRRECRAPDAPDSRVCKGSGERTRVSQVTPEIARHSPRNGLRLIPRSPWRPGFLATIARENCFPRT